MINIPPDITFTRQQIYQLCYDRYMFKTMFEGCYPDNPESFHSIQKRRHHRAIIFSVQNTDKYFYMQDQLKEW